MNAHSTASARARQPVGLKRIGILRHAKAGEGDGDDHARHLNGRGREDAERMGAFFKKKSIIPELVICSTANRTRETLAGLNVTVPTILAAKAYLASPGELLTLLQETDDAVQHILLIGHNPGMHALVVTLTGEYPSREDEELLALKFPTCAYAEISFKASRWKEIRPASGTLERLAIGSKL